MDFAIATFCFGDRYYTQTNRFIDSFKLINDKPEVFVVTDNPNKIKKLKFVNIINIKNFNEKYLEYGKKYHDFDFSVKRYALKYAFNNGYDKVILTDTDAIANQKNFNEENIQKCFFEDTLAGPVTYDYMKKPGRRFRFVEYEKNFNVEFDRKLLTEMSEDCVQYININGDKKEKFLDTWDECIKIKYEKNLSNRPAGNIDEMCFSSLYNGIKLKNNIKYSEGILNNLHDKWY